MSRRHLLGIRGIERDDLDELLDLTDTFVEVNQRPIPRVPALRGRTIVSLFFENVHHLPAWETLPFEHVSPNVVTMARRVQARHHLGSDAPCVVVASVRAVIQRISPTRTAPIEVDLHTRLDFDRCRPRR